MRHTLRTEGRSLSPQPPVAHRLLLHSPLSSCSALSTRQCSSHKATQQRPRIAKQLLMMTSARAKCGLTAQQRLTPSLATPPPSNAAIAPYTPTLTSFEHSSSPLSS